MVQHAVGLNIGSVLSRTFSIWAKNLVPFAILALIVHSPVILYCLLAPAETSTQISVFRRVTSFGPGVLSLVTSAAVAYGVFQQLRGRPASLGDCIGVGLRRLLPVLGVALCVGVLVGIGLILFVIPGIIVACILYVSIPVAVVEKAGVGASLSRSARLTKGARLPVFGISLLLGLVLGAVGLAFHFLVPVPQADPILAITNPQKYQMLDEQLVREHLPELRLQSVIQLVSGAILGLLTSIASVIVYYDLRSQKEQIDIGQIAAVFD
jgi:hypothetical protein